MTRVLLVIDVQESFRQGPLWPVISNPGIASDVARLVDDARATATSSCECCTPRGVLSKSHISPGNLNRRLRIEAMYFL